MRLLLARAAAKPDRTLSRINSRSNSAMLANIPKTKRPLAVLVSCRDGGTSEALS
jgi:hypothetical protein